MSSIAVILPVSLDRGSFGFATPPLDAKILAVDGVTRLKNGELGLRVLCKLIGRESAIPFTLHWTRVTDLRLVSTFLTNAPYNELKLANTIIMSCDSPPCWVLGIFQAIRAIEYGLSTGSSAGFLIDNLYVAPESRRLPYCPLMPPPSSWKEAIDHVFPQGTYFTHSQSTHAVAICHPVASHSTPINNSKSRRAEVRRDRRANPVANAVDASAIGTIATLIQNDSIMWD